MLQQYENSVHTSVVKQVPVPRIIYIVFVLMAVLVCQRDMQDTSRYMSVTIPPWQACLHSEYTPISVVRMEPHGTTCISFMGLSIFCLPLTDMLMLCVVYMVVKNQ